MRYLIILVIFSIFSLVVHAQLASSSTLSSQLNFGTNVDETQIGYVSNTKEKQKESKGKHFKILPDTQTIPIQFHVIVENDGDEDLTDSDIAQTLADLNSLFDQVGFVFETCSPINYISDSAFAQDINPNLNIGANGDTNTEEFIVANANIVANVINIFYAPVIEGAIDFGGIAGLPSQDRDWIFMPTKTANVGALGYSSTILAHQMGHYFNLYDTFRGEAFGATNELVARENDGSNNPVNCGEPGVGDELCDTPADPQYLDYFLNGNLSPFTISHCVLKFDCTWNESSEKFTTHGCGDIADISGEVYLPDHLNIMSNSYDFCLQYFSPGQIERMRISLIEDRSELLSNSCENCDRIKNLSGTHIQNSLLVYSVYEDIFSQATVKGENVPAGSIPARVIYNAGESICLNPSFEAEYGSNFLAYIDGCSPPAQPKNGDSNQNALLNTVTVQPNPFSKQTNIVYGVSTETVVTISISDITGKKLATLMENEQKNAGFHQLIFDATGMPAGIYYCTIQAGNHIETQKMVLTK